ncbi:Sas5p [Saccharomyces paradoxus]|uniref:Sas5p n=1 Tax=Saccharomyces paradoxus TaxID=27291 RepID=A0A8B8UZZ7_SACPA|nr:Sas5 [Saccharomyces paradoxus]QHS76308.1 Sas5 [Saccharomyces paradoxus]
MDRSIEVTFRVKTQQVIIPEQNIQENELPLRRWQMELLMLDAEGNEVEPTILSKCIYHLHPSFKQPRKRLNSLPFLIKETGWGEFNLKIECFFMDNAGKFSIEHDLTFEDDAYAVDYTVNVPYEFSHLNGELSKYFDVPWRVVSPEEEMSLRMADLPWVKSLALIDEDMMTDVVQMILNDPAVQKAIENHPRRERFFMFITQLPDELLTRIQAFLKFSNNRSTRQEMENLASDATSFPTRKEEPIQVHDKRSSFKPL